MFVGCYLSSLRRCRAVDRPPAPPHPSRAGVGLPPPHAPPTSHGCTSDDRLLLPRLSRCCSCSFHVARSRRLSGRRCHCCIRIQSRSSSHCRRRPSPLPPRRRCLRSSSRRVPRRGAPRRPRFSSPRHRRYSRWWYDRDCSKSAHYHCPRHSIPLLDRLVRRAPRVPSSSPRRRRRRRDERMRRRQRNDRDICSSSARCLRCLIRRRCSLRSRSS